MKKIILTLLAIIGVLINLNASADEVCTKQNTNISMSYNTAQIIAASSSCSTKANLLTEHWCNEITGTWWIKIMPREPQPACNPACVIDIANKTANINWMCMGLLPNTQTTNNQPKVFIPKK